MKNLVGYFSKNQEESLKVKKFLDKNLKVIDITKTKDAIRYSFEKLIVLECPPESQNYLPYSSLKKFDINKL